MEHFYTIQGEGFYQGKAAYFVRLGGCDIGCSWCDVKESWLSEKHPLWTVEEIINEVTRSGSQICVITGGEPMMYDLTELTSQLQANQIRAHLETSGAYPISGNWDWICMSPKRFKLPLEKCLNVADELKVIVAHRNDLRFGEEHARKVNKDCKLFFQPEWSVEKEMLPIIVEYVKQHQVWEISLQIHKYMLVP
ncbi:MAG: 7-carboxy-7-deazaguanine synthase QueE [Bacteroidetes bacterium]|nr:7-carboxy-7-deazaguanine synthase QueE [Bacteroidota bacterium]